MRAFRTLVYLMSALALVGFIIALMTYHDVKYGEQPEINPVYHNIHAIIMDETCFEQLSQSDMIQIKVLKGGEKNE